MNISFACPGCGRSYSVPPDYAGKRTKCKQCGGVIVVPTAAAPASAPDLDLYGLAEETAPLPPRAEAARPSAPTTRFGPAGGGKAKSQPKAKADGGSSRGWLSVGGGGIFILFMLIRFAIRLSRIQNPNPNEMNAGFVEPPPVVASRVVPDQPDPTLNRGNTPPSPSPVADASRAWTPPALPERGPMRQLEPGVTFQEIRIGPGRDAPGLPPAHGMTLYFYLPPGNHAPGSLPCVLVAPAGSILITGMGLGEGDMAEHLPYVKAGFAVLSYSLDGEMPDNGNDNQIKAASEKFLAAKAGLTNAKVALDWLAARAPEVDTNRIFAAGHSSAATLALLLAENEPRIKKCAAFAPRSDVEAHFPNPQKGMIQRLIPGVREFFTTYNPKIQLARIDCPVLLFHARDDTVVPASESEAFAAALKAAGKTVKLELVPSGGHHAPMISRGIPLAIAFFKEG